MRSYAEKRWSILTHIQTKAPRALCFIGVKQNTALMRGGTWRRHALNSRSQLFCPKGVAALYIREASGWTLNSWPTARIPLSGGNRKCLLDISLGAACALAEHWVGMESVRRLRDLLEYVPRETWQSHCSQHGVPTRAYPIH